MAVADETITLQAMPDRCPPRSVEDGQEHPHPPCIRPINGQGRLRWLRADSFFRSEAIGKYATGTPVSSYALSIAEMPERVGTITVIPPHSFGGCACIRIETSKLRPMESGPNTDPLVVVEEGDRFGGTGGGNQISGEKNSDRIQMLIGVGGGLPLRQLKSS